MADNEILLRFERVAAVYNGAIAALHGVDLEVRAGEIVALLGSNGAGKTTLLKAASNLLPAERGAVTAGQHQLPRPGRDQGGARPSWSAPGSCRCWRAGTASAR